MLNANKAHEAGVQHHYSFLDWGFVWRGVGFWLSVGYMSFMSGVGGLAIIEMSGREYAASVYWGTGIGALIYGVLLMWCWRWPFDD